MSSTFIGDDVYRNISFAYNTSRTIRKFELTKSITIEMNVHLRRQQYTIAIDMLRLGVLDPHTLGEVDNVNSDYEARILEVS